MRQGKDKLQGTLEMLVLRVLASSGELHGCAISDRIADISAEALRVEEGSLYPALHRMEEAGWIARSVASVRRRAAVRASHAAGLRVGRIWWRTWPMAMSAGSA